MVRTIAAKRALWWAGAAAIVSVAMIAAIVVKFSQPAQSFGTTSEARLLTQASLNAAGSIPEPEVAVEAAETGTEPIVASSPVPAYPTTPAIPAPGKTSALKLNPPADGTDSNPFSRYGPIMGEDGIARPGAGPTVACDVMNNAPPKILRRGETVSMNCTVTSRLGFSAPSTLSCGLSANRAPIPTDTVPGVIACSFNPPTVTPPPNGTASSTLTLQVPPDTPYDYYDYGFRVDSPGAQLSMPPVWPLNLHVERPAFSAECGSGTLSLIRGEDWANLSCRVTVPAGFDDGVEIIPGSLQSPDPSHIEYRTSVPSFHFGPEGGTQELLFSARAYTLGSGKSSLTLALRNSSGKSVRGAYVPLSIEIANPPGTA